MCSQSDDALGIILLLTPVDLKVLSAGAVVSLEEVLMHFVMLMLMSVYLMKVHPGVGVLRYKWP